MKKPHRDIEKEIELLDMADPRELYEYARDVIRGRWIEAEELIIRYASGYTETEIAELSYRYARDCIKGRFPAGEGIINNNKHPEIAYRYATECNREIYSNWKIHDTSDDPSLY